MNDNQIAMQSQQISGQTSQQLAHNLEQQSAAFQQLPSMVANFQQAYARSQGINHEAQQQHLEMLQASSGLALDELKRKQAAEELQWSQQLHQNDMLELTKRQHAAQTALIEAQTQKAIKDLDHDPTMDKVIGLDPETRRYLIKSGMIGDISGGKFVLRKPTQQEIDAADAEEKQSRAFELQKATASSEVLAEARQQVAQLEAQYRTEIARAREESAQARAEAQAARDAEKAKTAQFKANVAAVSLGGPLYGKADIDPETGKLVMRDKKPKTTGDELDALFDALSGDGK